MDKTIWLKFGELTLNQFERCIVGENRGTFSIKMGEALQANGIIMTFDETSIAGRHVSQNDYNSDVKFKDRPFMHQRKRQRKGTPSDIVFEQTCIVLNKMHKEEIVRFFHGERRNLSDYTIIPWKSPLRIPIDFVEITAFRPSRYGITATVVLGHHFVCYEIPIYPQLDPLRRTIIDSRIREEIEKIVIRKEVQEEIERVRISNHKSYPNKEFWTGIPGVDRDKWPGRSHRFY